MFSVAKSEDEVAKDPKYRHCFEVNTRGRGYLFCADSAEEMEEWMKAFNQIINSDAADNLVSAIPSYSPLHLQTPLLNPTPSYK